MKTPLLAAFGSLLYTSVHLFAQNPTAPAALEPTQSNVPYGTHERQVLDFYQAKSESPTPVVFFIHGGGWVSGDKKNPPALSQYIAMSTCN